MSRVVFNEEKCKGCELCVLVCPRKIVKIGEHTNSRGFRPAIVTEQDRCASCALCARICPDTVITVYKNPSTVKEG